MYITVSNGANVTANGYRRCGSRTPFICRLTAPLPLASAYFGRTLPRGEAALDGL
jgi:hypothetical protein